VSYDLYAWDTASGLDDAAAIRAAYLDVLGSPAAARTTSGHLQDFEENVRAVLGNGVELHVSSWGIVVHLAHSADQSISIVEILASASGLGIYDPQTDVIELPGSG
jgi:hypothetical protein